MENYDNFVKLLRATIIKSGKVYMQLKLILLVAITCMVKTVDSKEEAFAM